MQKMEEKDPTKKSWEIFKTHFTEAHQDLQDFQKTGRNTGYQANLEETSKKYESDALISIQNIANMAIEDRKTMKNLADTNTELVKKWQS